MGAGKRFPGSAGRERLASPGRRAGMALASLLVALAMPLFLFLADVEGVAYHLSAYEQSFVASGAPAATGLTADQLLVVITRTLDYATGRRQDFQFDLSEIGAGPPGRPAFSEIEVAHMADVRALFLLGRAVRRAALWLVVLGAAALLALDRARGGARLARALMAGSAVTMVAWGALAVAVLLDFGSFWTGFHETLFSNDLWLLPSGSLLIEMLPESLFQRLALEVVGLLTVEALAILFLSAGYLRNRAVAR